MKIKTSNFLCKIQIAHFDQQNFKTDHNFFLFIRYFQIFKREFEGMREVFPVLYKSTVRKNGNLYLSMSV